MIKGHYIRSSLGSKRDISRQLSQLPDFYTDAENKKRARSDRNQNDNI